MGIEPMNSGFAGRSVCHFATRARPKTRNPLRSGSGFRRIKNLSFLSQFPMPTRTHIQQHIHMLLRAAETGIEKFT